MWSIADAKFALVLLSMRRNKIVLCVTVIVFYILFVRELSNIYNWRPPLNTSYRRWVNLMMDQAANVGHVVQKSEDGNLSVRMKFQQVQVKQYCERMGLGGQAFRWPEKPKQKADLLTHIITSNSTRTLLCYTDNMGSVDLLEVILRSVRSANATSGTSSTDEWSGSPKLERDSLQADQQALLNVEQIINDGGLSSEEQGLNHTPILNETLHHWHVHNFFKFTFVRHPLERLLFAYLDHLQDPLYQSSDHFPNSLKQEIFEKYRPVVYQRWIETGGAYNISITFSEFVNYYVESFQERLDARLKPYTEVCCPCQVRYHFYGRHGRLVSEINTILKHLGLNWDLWRDAVPLPGSNVTDKLLDYYGQLTAVEKSQLYDAMRQELLFYYHLYPGERFSHVTLLGINEELYKTAR